MEEVFNLSKRKGSNKWHFCKRYPLDVAPILKGEFNKSTGEEDRKRAQQRLPLIAAEYERRVEEARRKLSFVPKEDISEAEAAGLAADFYRRTLTAYTVKRPVEKRAQEALLDVSRHTLQELRASLGRHDYGPVAGVVRVMLKDAGINLPDDSPSWLTVHNFFMRALIEVREHGLAQLEGRPHYTPKDSFVLNPPEVQSQHSIEALLEAYEADKSPKWSALLRRP